MSNKIEIGDKVSVSWAGNGLIEGVVIYVPCMQGDVWIIETENAINYVQSFEMIWKSKPNAEVSRT